MRLRLLLPERAVSVISEAEKHTRLSASLMCANWLDLRAELDRLILHGIDYLHVDIVDGTFAPDFTMGSSIINQVRDYLEIPFEYHLMVERPMKIVDMLPPKEGDILTIHQEATRSLHRDLMEVRKRGFRPGVALSPGTSPVVLDYVLEDIEFIQVLTVNPGFKGQRLVSQAVGKIGEIRQRLDHLGIQIELSVDGNVNELTIPEMLQAGADTLVLGSSGYFRSDISTTDAMRRIRAVIHDSWDKS